MDTQYGKIWAPTKRKSMVSFNTSFLLTSNFTLTRKFSFYTHQANINSICNCNLEIDQIDRKRWPLWNIVPEIRDESWTITSAAALLTRVPAMEAQFKFLLKNGEEEMAWDGKKLTNPAYMDFGVDDWRYKCNFQRGRNYIYAHRDFQTFSSNFMLVFAG